MRLDKTIIYRVIVLFGLTGFLFAPFKSFSQKNFYIPKGLVTPLHDKAHQLHLSAGLGAGFDFNLSYSFHKHLFVFASNTFNKGERHNANDALDIFYIPYNIFTDDRAVSYGIGYFKKKRGFLNVLELMAGYGNYTVSNHWYYVNNPKKGEITNAGYWSPFAQINIGRNSKYYELGLSGRLSYINYTYMRFMDLDTTSSYKKHTYEDLKGINFDPVVHFGGGIKRLFIDVQAGFSIAVFTSNIKNIEESVTFNQRTISQRIMYPPNGPSGIIARLSLQYHLNFTRK
jgi:hypothetical protein